MLGSKIKQQLKEMLLEISDNEDFLLEILSNIKTEKYRVKMIDFITNAKRRGEEVNRERLLLLSVALGNEEDKECGNYDLLSRLRAGDKVKCMECQEGIYVTREGYKKTANVFWCNKCGRVYETLPGNVIVE